MTIYECSVCGHLEFDQAPAKCLVCRSVNSFKANPDAIKRPGQSGSGELDAKHIPAIQIGSDTFFPGTADSRMVAARMGDVEHPMKKEHYIVWVDFYFDHRFINRVWLSPEVNRPAAAVSVKATQGLITVCQHCNLHGTWMSEKPMA
jgi:desulfoferrodoxin-like iron-binding protein